MFGLDDWVASFSDGTTLLLVVVVAVVLGLRHATDPDHLAAVTTLVAGGRERATRVAARLGLAGASATRRHCSSSACRSCSSRRYLPEPVQQGAETAVGVLIIALAAPAADALAPRPVPRSRPRPRDRDAHARPHPRQRRSPAPLGADAQPAAGVRDRARARPGWKRGVGVLLLASIHDRGLAVGALAIFAVCTAASMSAPLDRLRAHARSGAGAPGCSRASPPSSASRAWRSASGTRWGR